MPKTLQTSFSSALFLKENIRYWLKVHNVSCGSQLFQVRAWSRPGTKPSQWSMMTRPIDPYTQLHIRVQLIDPRMWSISTHASCRIMCVFCLPLLQFCMFCRPSVTLHIVTFWGSMPSLIGSVLFHVTYLNISLLCFQPHKSKFLF